MAVHLHQIVCGLTEAGRYSRLTSSDGLDDATDDMEAAKVEATVMAGTAEFLETNERDEYWQRFSDQSRRVSILTQLAEPT
jgi:hypothetical protein